MAAKTALLKVDDLATLEVDELPSDGELYANVIAIIGAGVQMGTLKDVGAYVFILLCITIGVHYCAKCAVAGPAIRGSVARAFSIGRRGALIGR